ncbi:site-2 protease family protein [Hymenobacter humi]
MRIGRIAGIPILIHWTFLLLLGFIIYSQVLRGSSTAATLAAVGFVLVLFACVVLHELGHALTAKHFGFVTRKITLLPIGGIASLEQLPDSPRQELLVALAGPAVNVLIALGLYPFVSGAAFAVPDIGRLTTAQDFVSALFQLNLTLALFNLLPAFPMDGGRVLRALLSFWLDRLRATRFAAGLGKLMALAFVFFGLLSNPFLVLIGLFVYFGAHAEALSVEFNELLRDYTVRNAMMTNFLTLAPTDNVQAAADKLLAGSDQDLLVVDAERVVGVMPRQLILEALREKRQSAAVTEVMKRDFETVQVGDKLSQVFANAMQQSNAFYPVLENNRLQGIIDLNNLTEFVAIRAALSA